MSARPGVIQGEIVCKNEATGEEAFLISVQLGEVQKTSVLVHGNNAVVCLTAKSADYLCNLWLNSAAGLGATVVKYLDALSDAVVNAVSVESILREEQFRVTMRDETIRNSHSDHAHFIL